MDKLHETNNISDPLDYFIFASGRDDRAYQVLFKHTPDKISKVIALNYETRVSGYSNNDSIYKYRIFSTLNLQEITCNIQEPTSIVDEIDTNPITNTSRIGIDISCMTKPFFYYILKLLREKYQIQNLKVYYTEPQSYFLRDKLFDDFHTGSGQHSLKEIPGFSGMDPKSSPRKLVVLLGFDGGFSRQLDQDISPRETMVVNGFPSYTPKFKDISLVNNVKLISRDDVRIFYASANNPFDTYNILEAIKTDTSDWFFNIAPLGPKPMALGACIFALHNRDVRVVYPWPEIYEDKYSEMTWNSWVYDIPLNLIV